MSQQFDLFPAPVRVAAPIPVDPIAGFVPMPVHRGSPYVPFDGALAKRVILERCAHAGTGWVSASRLCRDLRMYPSDVARLASRLADVGLLEETYLYYGSSQIGPDYKGFDYGYRLPQQPEEARV